MARRCATDRSRTDFECPRSWPSGIPPRRGRSSRAGPVDTGVEPAAAVGGGGRRGRHDRLSPQPCWRHSWGRGMPDSHPARSPVLPMRGGIPRSDGAFMRALIRIACLALLASGLGAATAAAQATPQPADSRFSPHELVDTGHKFFGGDLRVYWQGPTLGWDVGGEGARTMMLVYNLPATQAVYQRFGGVDGSAYFVGGLGMTVLTANGIVVIPIRSGVGVRLGANVGYLKFTPQATWNPF